MFIIPASWRLIDKFIDGSAYYRIPMSELANIQTWSGNRYIDMNHVDRLRDSARNHAVFEGPYTVVELVEDDGARSLNLIDGQHRRQVRCYDEHGTLRTDSGSVLVQYYSNKSEQETIEIFKQKNNCLPFKYSESALRKYHLLIARMQSCMEERGDSWVGKDCIKTAKTVRPRVQTTELEKRLRGTGIFQDGDDGPTVEQIFHEVIRINREELVRAREILKITDTTAQRYALNREKYTTTMLQSALVMGFGLGLRQGLPWVNSIEFTQREEINLLDFEIN
jgi:hypothetical protein